MSTENNEIQNGGELKRKLEDSSNEPDELLEKKLKESNDNEKIDSIEKKDDEESEIESEVNNEKQGETNDNQGEESEINNEKQGETNDNQGEEGQNKNKEDVKKTDSRFDYSKRGDFTSEVFKIIVKGLPAFFGIGEVRKHFEVLLNARVCKVIPTNRNPHRSRHKPGGVFITFYDEETRQRGLEKLNGYIYKGKKLSAAKAHAMPDPFMARMTAEKSPEEIKKQEETCTEEKLKDVTIPLWNMTYEQQLEFKMSEMKTLINNMVDGIEKNAPHLKSWFDSQRSKNNGLPVILDPIRGCKKPEGYRNKCEFSPGVHPQTKEKIFGFRFGKYSEGSVFVGSVQNLIQVHPRMKHVVKLFEQYVHKSKYDMYDVVTQCGHWKLLMCRYADKGDELMVKIGFDPQELSREELDQVKSDLKEYFENTEEGKSMRTTSVLFHVMPRRLAVGATYPPVELVTGKLTITHELFDLKFEISPGAFFQINTEACHTLYDTVAEMAQLNTSTTLLDVCSGVGTIGLCLAKRCGEVIGVEISEESVKDAAHNAEYNNITNATYHSGRAEHIMSALLNKATNKNIVAVLDPPRAGIHHMLAATLRHSSLERIVYLACDSKSVMNGFNGLSYSASKKFPKSPFVPVRVVPVDMFPYTKQCEWVILMQRFESLLSDY